MLMTTGTVDFGKEVDSSLLAAHIAARLRGVDANDVDARPNSVTFKAGVFRFVTNWNILVSFGFGDLVVDPQTHEIHYRLELPATRHLLGDYVCCHVPLLVDLFPRTRNILSVLDDTRTAFDVVLYRLYQRSPWG